MTITSTVNKATSTADGVATVYNYNFPVLEDSHMKVYFDSVLQGSGYTVTGAGNPAGGTVVFSVAPTAGVQVDLIREVPLTQETDYGEYDSFPAESHEKALDRAAMRDQQLQEQIDRVLSYTLTDVPAGGVVLPAPEAFKAIGYDATGNLTLLVVGVGGDPVVNPLLANLESGGLDIVGTDANVGGNETFRLEGLTGNATFIGELTATGFNGDVVGDLTGNVTGDVTGNVTGGTITGDSLTINGNVAVNSGDLVVSQGNESITLDASTGNVNVTGAFLVNGSPFTSGGGLFKGENGEVGSQPGDIFRINEQTLNANVTIDADENASCTGPLTVATGFSLTVAAGGTLVIL